MNFQGEIFYLTINFLPKYDKEFELVQGDVYKHIVSGQLYRKRLLADHGWGQESGYVRYPEPTFEELIAILEYVPDPLRYNPFYFLSKEMSTYFNNVLGAVSVIMQDYVPELIDFLSEKVETTYFKNRYIRRNFQEFSFVRERQQMGRAVGSKPYHIILQEYDKWEEISHKVIKQVYGK